jgi:hypothetical protein
VISLEAEENVSENQMKESEEWTDGQVRGVAYKKNLFDTG